MSGHERQWRESSPAITGIAMPVRGMVRFAADSGRASSPISHLRCLIEQAACKRIASDRTLNDLTAPGIERVRQSDMGQATFVTEPDSYGREYPGNVNSSCGSDSRVRAFLTQIGNTTGTSSSRCGSPPSMEDLDHARSGCHRRCFLPSAFIPQ